MNVMSRRLAKIEAAVIKPAFVPKVCRLIAGPRDDATPEQRAVFEKEFTKDRAECDLIIRLIPLRPVPQVDHARDDAADA